MISVVNRKNESVPLDIAKIRNVIAWACEELNISAIALEANFSEQLRDNLTTRQIQNNLIQCALSLASVNEPDWTLVAGRLHLWNLKKDAAIFYENKPTIERFLQRIYEGQYSSLLIDHYSISDLEYATTWISDFKDKVFDYAGIVTLSSKFLLPHELPQECFLATALMLATVEQPDNRMAWAELFYERISNREISLASPLLANARLGKKEHNLSSCFVLALEDSLESIYGNLAKVAKISQEGGGVGVCFSQVRAKGSWFRGLKNASGGVIPWLKLYNDTAIAVNQGGRRAGAITCALDIWHYDTPEFLEIQTEAGDQRFKAYDIFPQVVIPDLFMVRVINDRDWLLVDPYEVEETLDIKLWELWGEEFERAYALVEAHAENLKLKRQISAKELFKTIMRSQLETGMPYLAFKDTINRANPNQHDGYIPCVNLCTESYSNVAAEETAHCCNLVSLNLANIVPSQLNNICYEAVRLLDNAIELSHPPVDIAAAHNDQYRTIGVGIMGLADYLACKKPANIYEVYKLSTILMEKIAFYSLEASNLLARERGAYSKFEGSQWSKGLFGDMSADLALELSLTDLPWNTLLKSIQIFGIRNSQVLAIAPNTTTSLIQGCSASYLPVFKKEFYNKAKGALPIFPPYLKEFGDYYLENINLPQKQIVHLTAALQRWVDTGISMELLFNLNCLSDAKQIYDVLHTAWVAGCKTVYYVRTVQRDNYQEECLSCAN